MVFSDTPPIDEEGMPVSLTERDFAVPVNPFTCLHEETEEQASAMFSGRFSSGQQRVYVVCTRCDVIMDAYLDGGV